MLKLDGWIQKNKSLASTIGIIVGGALALIGVIGAIGLVAWPVITGINAIIAAAGAMGAIFTTVGSAVMTAISAISWPVVAVVAAIVAGALLIRKYWEPVSAFFGGVVEGLKAAFAPVGELFTPLKPLFNWLGEKLQAAWQWFKNLIAPVTIRARSADFRGTLNSRREGSWHDTTLGAIVEAIASRNRLEASVAPSLAGIKIPHIDQSQESDAKFLTRLAERNGGEVSVKMGKLLFLKAGQGVTSSGKKIPQITITRSDGDRHHFAIADRGAYTGVTAKWLHTKDPKPQKQKVKLKRKKKEKHLRALEHPKAKPVTQKKAPKVPEAREGEYMAGEADNVFALTTVYATKAQAMRAAQAKWDKLQRGVAEFSISLATGRADIYTETPVRVSGFKRVIDEQDWTITKVTHFLNNSGFTTSLELEVRLSDVEYETEGDE